MSYLFVSYSRWDRQSQKLVFDRLLLDLRKAGIEVWLAPDNVPAGIEWKDAIREAVDGAGALLYLVSYKSNARGMLRELEQAMERNLPVFPAVLDRRGIEKLPPPLHPLPLHDFEADYDDALASLLEALPESVRHQRPVKAEAPQSKGYVFISYAEEDGEFVGKLRAFLKEKGYGFWDYQDSDRNYQVQLFLELEEVIQNATATISVLSPDWKRSKWTAKEYLYTEEVGKPVFLLMARPMEPTLVIAGVPYIDFTRDMEQGFAKLDRELRRKGLI